MLFLMLYRLLGVDATVSHQKALHISLLIKSGSFMDSGVS